MGAPWTEERIARLKQMIAEKRSAAEAGAELGISRNAALGKAHRLGLNFSGSHAAPKGEGRKPRAVRDLANRDRLISATLRLTYTEKPNATENRRAAKPFVEVLGKPVCKWFLKGEEGATGLVCGHAVEPGHSYCLHHLMRSASAARSERAAA